MSGQTSIFLHFVSCSMRHQEFYRKCYFQIFLSELKYALKYKIYRFGSVHMTDFPFPCMNLRDYLFFLVHDR